MEMVFPAAAEGCGRFFSVRTHCAVSSATAVSGHDDVPCVGLRSLNREYEFVPYGN